MKCTAAQGEKNAPPTAVNWIKQPCRGSIYMIHICSCWSCKTVTSWSIDVCTEYAMQCKSGQEQWRWNFLTACHVCVHSTITTVRRSRGSEKQFRQNTACGGMVLIRLPNCAERGQELLLAGRIWFGDWYGGWGLAGAKESGAHAVQLLQTKPNSQVKT